MNDREQKVREIIFKYNRWTSTNNSSDEREVCNLDDAVKEICQLFPPEVPLEGTYTLNCDNCHEPYECKSGFPKPQLCPKCSLELSDPCEVPGDAGYDYRKFDMPVKCKLYNECHNRCCEELHSREKLSKPPLDMPVIWDEELDRIYMEAEIPELGYVENCKAIMRVAVEAQRDACLKVAQEHEAKAVEGKDKQIELLKSGLQLANKTLDEMNYNVDSYVEQSKKEIKDSLIKSGWKSPEEVKELLQEEHEQGIGELEDAKQDTVREIIAWGVEPCPHWIEVPIYTSVIKRDCALCWQSLKAKYGGKA